MLDDLSFSVDLNKIAYVDKFSETNSSLYNCFKLLRSLSCDSDIPETMFRDIPYAPLSDSRAIANGFNTFFGSVLLLKLLPISLRLQLNDLILLSKLVNGKYGVDIWSYVQLKYLDLVFGAPTSRSLNTALSIKKRLIHRFTTECAI